MQFIQIQISVRRSGVEERILADGDSWNAHAGCRSRDHPRSFPMAKRSCCAESAFCLGPCFGQGKGASPQNLTCPEPGRRPHSFFWGVSYQRPGRSSLFWKASVEQVRLQLSECMEVVQSAACFDFCCPGGSHFSSCQI